MDTPTKVITTLFTPEQLEHLEEVFDKEKGEYLDNLEKEPFTTDLTVDRIEEEILKMYPDLEDSMYLLTPLAQEVEYYFI